MNLRTIDWKNGKIKLIDQTKLPLETRYQYISDIRSLWEAIKSLKVRGAPALGAAAALGVYLGIKDSKAKNFPALNKQLKKIASYLAASRPTAKNLFWALERMKKIAMLNKNSSIPLVKRKLFSEALKIMEEDRISCRKIGEYGAKLLKDRDRVLTVCNAGILATIDYGTALGVIYRAKEQKKKIKVFSCETRPLLQGARLTCWELGKKAVEVTLICDNMAAFLMQEGCIDKVIVGADRIARNGDTANKIGTLGIAILSRYHKIPFYVAAPVSTFDLSLSSGQKIPIEERGNKEVTELFFEHLKGVKNIDVYNPAFDVTPNELITAIITDKGIIKPPFKKNIKKLLG